MRRLRRTALSALAALAAAVGVVAGPASVARADDTGFHGSGRTIPRRDVGQPLPVYYSGAATQWLLVRADCRTCTTGTLQAWTVTGPGRGVPVTAPVRAMLGQAGVGPGSEFSTATPVGTFDLPEAFGIKTNPGTAMPYFTADANDWWDGRSGLPTYNTHVRSSVPIEGERLLAAGWVYDHAIVMGVNPGHIPYAGSAFFVHVTDGRPTLGCVAIDEPTLVAILRWLTPAAHPQITVTY